MTRALPLLLLTLLAASAMAQTGIRAFEGADLSAIGFSRIELEALEPTSPNPFLGNLLPGVTPDYDYWTARTIADGFERGQVRALRGFRSAPTARVQERERPGSAANDDTPQPLGPFDTGEEPSIDLTGMLDSAPERVVARQGLADEGESTRPDGSWSLGMWTIPLQPIEGQTTTTILTARIGDGTFGNSSGDVDVYEIDVPEPNTHLKVAVRTPVGALQADMALFSPNVNAMFVVESDGDPRKSIFLPDAGKYYLFVWGRTPGGQAPGLRRLDPSTGYGVGSTGPYELHVSAAHFDADSYSVELRAGDVLSAVTPSPTVTDIAIYGPDGSTRMRSRYDLSGSYAENGPLTSPSEMGAAENEGVSVATVAPVAGTYTIVVQGEGAYLLKTQGTRPGHERSRQGRAEVIYVDFDGGLFWASEDIDGAHPIAQISPLTDFLPNWGLTAQDEDAVIDAILATLRRHLRDGLRQLEGMGELDVVILNSRDHADPEDSGMVANRLVIGGTASELGVKGVYGIASTVDIGNFRHDDIAFILLDSFSAPADNPNSLNSLGRNGRSMVELIGLGVGKTATHEAGHFLGLHHTNNSNDVHNIIDEGGAPLSFSLNIGEDNVFGPGDGNLAFRDDAFQALYPFSGRQTTPMALAHSLHTAHAPAPSASSPSTTRPPLPPDPEPTRQLATLMVEHGFSMGAYSVFGLLPREARLAIEETFDDASRGWGISLDSGARSVVKNGALHITPSVGRGLWDRPDGHEIGGMFAARYRVRYESGCTKNGAGLEFWIRDGSKMSTLLIASDKGYGLLQELANGAWVNHAGWTPVESVQPGEWNTVEVLSNGESVVVFVNGQRALSTALTPPPGRAAFALSASSCSSELVTYAIDDLTVLEIEPSAAMRSMVPTADRQFEEGEAIAPSDDLR